MDEKQKQTLLKIAKDSINSAVSIKSVGMPQCEDPELCNEQGCFVTIKNQGSLRGCIGQFTSDIPLYQLVCKMAVASATQDARFSHDPITPAELEKLSIEISVLSPLERTDDPLSLRLGTDGIYIIRGGRSGCFLPQVAEETGWNKEEFLSYCCQHKAFLPPDAWKDPDTEVYLFSADAFEAEFNDI